MKLESLRLTPRGDSGWESGTLTFGRTTTLFLGPNGAGKTPLMKAIGFALGHRVEVPPLVQQKCESAVLTFFVGERRFSVERKFSDELAVSATDEGNATLAFTTESAYSEWMFTKIGIPLRSLLTTTDKLTPPYMSVVGPTFLVDQDTGWTDTYVPPETVRFVKQQREEVLRWVLDIPARNRPIAKDEFQSAKNQYEIASQLLAIKKGVVQKLQEELGLDAAPDAAERLQERSTQLEDQIARARTALGSLSEVDSGLDALVSEALQNRAPLAFRLESLQKRQRQLTDVRREVEAELGALEENEVAADAFRHFCGNENCGFFRKPEESYGRRVLYLKDQLKDFDTSGSEALRELDLLRQQLASAEEDVQKAVAVRNGAQVASGGNELPDVIRSSSEALSEVHDRLARTRRLAAARSQLEALVTREARAVELVDALRPTAGPRRDNSRMADIRPKLARNFKEWLVSLRTPNVSPDVTFDDELRLIIDGERFSAQSSHSGSTRARIVLAFHAAVLETSMELDGKHPPLLVLDAPRQHELSAADLRSFVKRFYTIFSRAQKSAQLVFSATDSTVQPENCIDRVLQPAFKIGGQLHFLGPVPPSTVGKNE